MLYSIGAIFSYDCRSNITSGCVISGGWITSWAKSVEGRLREIPNPLLIPVLMAETLINTAFAERRALHQVFYKVEDQARKDAGFQEPSMASVEESSGADIQIRNTTRMQMWRRRGKTEQSRAWMQDSSLKGYRSLTSELSQANRCLGRLQLLIERASLVLKFVEQNNTVDLFPPNLNSPPVTESIAALASRAKFVQSSLESLQADQKNYPQRLQSQTMIVTNLVAQQEVALSLQVATDSKEIAAASRRDSTVMKIIAALGALFLPGTFIAVRPPKRFSFPTLSKPNPLICFRPYWP